MARYLYTLIYYVIFPLVLLRLWWRGKKAPQYRQRWLERLGVFTPPSDSQPTLWIHSVSVGETIAAAPLIRMLQKRYPHIRLVVTTMTPTGSERVRSLFGDTVFHVYAPYDLPGCIKRFYRRLRPMALIVMETELWPNWVHFCRQQNIPSILANGRLSERSAKGYEKVRWLSGAMFAEISWVAAQNSLDAARFTRLGVKNQNLSVTGSIKFDIQVTDDIRQAGQEFRQQWGDHRPVIMAGSTHDGEESILLEVCHRIRLRHPDVLLIIVPRHPERFELVAGMIEKSGLTMSRRSRSEPFSPEVQIVLGDTMGEQMKFYAAADLAFVGGSLIERGGHNPLEPAALGLPVLMGPHVFNFQDICNRLETEGALVTVSEASLQEEIEVLLQSDQLRQERGMRAEQFVKSNQGALEQLMSGIEDLISPMGTRTGAPIGETGQ